MLLICTILTKAGDTFNILLSRSSKQKYPGKPLYLEVRTWNERAVRCYQKAGFVIDGDIIEQETYIGRSTFYRMIKKNI